MPLRRFENNPLLTPEDVKPTRDDLTVLCTMNPAAVRVGDQVLLLVRVGEAARQEAEHVCYLYFDAEASELRTGRLRRDDPDLTRPDGRGWFHRGKMLLTSLSHLRIARSGDGKHFTCDDKPAIFPTTPYEAFGCEDARITPLDGRYWITYTAVSDRGVAVALASTSDFVTFARHGLIFPPYNKDVCIFPRKVRGQYVCRHRPYKSEFNDACIWTAYSPDLLAWGTHEITMSPEPGTWSSDRVGAGAPPIRTSEGWLEIYHAVDADGRYALGASLSDLEHPERISTRGSVPVFLPETPYECDGVYDDVVFSNGIVTDGETLTVFYGAADRICAAAVTTIDEMIDAAKA